MQIVFLLIGIVVGGVIGFLVAKQKKQEDGVFDTSDYDKKITALETEKLLFKKDIENASKEKENLKQEFENRKAELVKEKEIITTELNAERAALNNANNRLARAEEAFRGQEDKLKAQKAELEEIQKKLTSEFENIANKILDEKSKKFTDQNKINLDNILNPLKERIKDFEDKVEKTYKAESAERITLKTEIKQLVELNKQVSDDANNLSKALKGDNKTQGNWGEVILEKILERSGLSKERGEYKTQVSLNNAHGETIRPDAIIYLPDNKHIVVDSKVSLVAYKNYVAAVTVE